MDFILNMKPTDEYYPALCNVEGEYNITSVNQPNDIGKPFRVKVQELRQRGEWICHMGAGFFSWYLRRHVTLVFFNSSLKEISRFNICHRLGEAFGCTCPNNERFFILNVDNGHYPSLIPTNGSEPVGTGSQPTAVFTASQPEVPLPSLQERLGRSLRTQNENDLILQGFSLPPPESGDLVPFNVEQTTEQLSNAGPSGLNLLSMVKNQYTDWINRLEGQVNTVYFEVKGLDAATKKRNLETFTKNMIKKENLLMMKKDAIIINTSRGGIINESIR